MSNIYYTADGTEALQAAAASLLQTELEVLIRLRASGYFGCFGGADRRGEGCGLTRLSGAHPMNEKIELR
jgi:hypothetical protein